MASTERWTSDPAPHDFPAALDYLTLLLDRRTAGAVVAGLKHAPVSTRKAKDLLRSSGLGLLPTTDPEVTKDLKKVKKGQPLSPVLLLRGDVTTGRPLLVADGYHRICTSYHLDEDADVPCRIADLPGGAPSTSRRPSSA
jgi:hypothetical protein